MFLWATPRCLSTAFEFSIWTLPNAQVFHQPYTASYFFGPDHERKSERHARRPPPSNTGSCEFIGRSYAEASLMLQAEYPGKDFVFAKEHAFQVQGKFDMFLEDGFKDFTHTFLIRHPQRTILSLYKGCTTNSDATGWTYFDPKEVGFFELRDLYSFVQQHLHISPVVIDADDLLANPDAMMKAYCAAVGITYRDGMTTWKPGGNPDFVKQKVFGLAWSQTVIKSSGFMKPIPMPPLPDDLPTEVTKCIEECLAPYKELYSVRLVPAEDL